MRMSVGRRGGAAAEVEYCAGLYDRERRRYLRRACGYTGFPTGSS